MDKIGDAKRGAGCHQETRGNPEHFRLQFEAISQFTPEKKAVARTVLESLILRHTANRFSRMNPANGHNS